MKTLIPKKEQENVLALYWSMLTHLEGIAETPMDKADVTAGYTVLNRIKFTTHRPRWEKKTS